ncbi:hypothetical protein FRC00_009505 [Tulasnella sp. 408]|nr:hypothetical protein FRC00_009505 [Tulasnella sp. 408]
MPDSTLRTHESIYDSPKETSELIMESKEDIRRFSHNIIDIRVTKRIGDRPLYAYTILDALLEHAPTLQGQRYVASAILSQGNDIARLTELSRVWLDRLLSPELEDVTSLSQVAVRCLSWKPLVSKTRKQMQGISLVIAGWYDNSSRRQMQELIESQLLERHGYKCAVSLFTYDKDTPSSIAVPEKFVSRKLHAVHIIPFCLSRDGGFNSTDTTDTWDMLEDWAGISPATLSGEKINDLSNLILMSTEVHEDFGNFTFWFEPTDQLNTYTVHLEERQIRFQWASTVAFSNQSDRDLPLPSPEFLAAHAALAKVFRVTGAGDYIDRLWMDAEESGGLSVDGSSDVGVLLSLLQRSWDRST